MIVTAVARQRGRRRVNLFVDGRFVLALGAGLAAERGLRVGMPVTQDELSVLAAEEERRRALESVLRLLSYRPRSERELRERLARKGYARVAVDVALARVRELGYLDDAAFARFWAETRQAARPRSKRLLAGELRRRGVATELAEEATADISDEEAAYRAAGGRLRVLRGLEYGTFRERLGGFLTRRGFSYGVARRTIERCWVELASPEAEGGAL